MPAILFFLNSMGLGVGLAMDAFTVSIADGLSEPDMSTRRKHLIAGTFAFFQMMMPLAGWFCVHTVISVFGVLEQWIPWIAFVILGLIGANMVKEGFSDDAEASGNTHRIGVSELIMQAVATSIDALSVGITIAEYPFSGAAAAAVIIGAVTYAICLGGIYLGGRVGTRFNRKASVFGGAILIFIGAEILIRGLFF